MTNFSLKLSSLLSHRNCIQISNFIFMQIQKFDCFYNQLNVNKITKFIALLFFLFVRMRLSLVAVNQIVDLKQEKKDFPIYRWINCGSRRDKENSQMFAYFMSQHLNSAKARPLSKDLASSHWNQCFLFISNLLKHRKLHVNLSHTWTMRENLVVKPSHVSFI